MRQKGEDWKKCNLFKNEEGFKNFRKISLYKMEIVKGKI